MPFTTRANPYSPTLSQNRFGVATIVNESQNIENGSVSYENPWK